MVTFPMPFIIEKIRQDSLQFNKHDIEKQLDIQKIKSLKWSLHSLKSVNYSLNPLIHMETLTIQLKV